jgi:hypothetical protein
MSLAHREYIPVLVVLPAANTAADVIEPRTFDRRDPFAAVMLRSIRCAPEPPLRLVATSSRHAAVRVMRRLPWGRRASDAERR